MTRHLFIQGSSIAILFLFFVISIVDAQNITEPCNWKDTIIKFYNFNQIRTYDRKDPIVFMTHDIVYKLGFAQVDTSCNTTRDLLDSLSILLSSKKASSIEVGIHLSQKYTEEYSFNYNQIYEDIIQYMRNNGLSPDITIVGHNYYDYEPLIDCHQISDSCACKRCMQYEFSINKRVEFLINFDDKFLPNIQKDTIFLNSNDFTVVEDSACLVRLKISSDTLSSRIVQSPEAVIVFSIDSNKYIARGKHIIFAASDPSNCNAYFCYLKDRNVSIQNNILTLHTCFVVDPEIKIKPKKYKPPIRKH